MGRFFDDFTLGERAGFGAVEVRREEVIDFARRFDPQPFHLDEEAARRSPFGGLIASGWHTVALTMRLMVEALGGGESGSLGSPGADRIRWLEPVRPGDVLSVELEVRALRPSRSKPDRGLVEIEVTTLNQHRRPVMTMLALGIFRRRE
ncbi:MAG: MaoC family dehydratase [Acidobacteria bacterium]|nr:MAG: MaoC family dehydratase [Acidobacteriota bacterium]